MQGRLGATEEALQAADAILTSDCFTDNEVHVSVVTVGGARELLQYPLPSWRALLGEEGLWRPVYNPLAHGGTLKIPWFFLFSFWGCRLNEGVGFGLGFVSACVLC